MKCGLEIHQRICDKKLFCDCDATIKEPRVIKKINRYLHPVIGEGGKFDKAVLFEANRSRKFTYEVTVNSSCLVETDSEPPHKVNEEALRTALSVAKHFNMLIPDEIHVMRKTVIDGSNTTGFQRTMIIGLGTKDSYIKTSKGKVRIKDLELEEESARIVSRNGVYSLNALGTPLIEIGTYPDIRSPEQAYEVALKIGETLRLTGKAQRGIGTIRQDVNVSVKGGARVEIKGFQELRDLPKLIKYEVMRQESLIKLKKDLGIFDVKKVNLTHLFSNSDSRIVKNKKFIMGLVVTNFKGLFSRKLNPVKTLGSELADYARVMGVKGLIHSDEDLSKYKLKTEFITAYRELGLSDNDLLLIISGDDGELVNNALTSVENRIRLLNDKIPEETRIANKDCSTSYARPLPGGDRMYPETDVPLIKPLSDIPIIETKEERVNKLRSLGLTDELINKLVLSPRLRLFNELISDGYDPLITAKLLTVIPREVKTRFHKDVNLEVNDLRIILNYLRDGLISIKSIPEILAKGVNSINEYLLMSDDELLNIIQEVVSNNPGLTTKQLVGLIMKRVGLRANSKRVMELINK